MKKHIVYICLLIFLSACNSTLMDKSALYQKELKAFYEDPATTPLSEEERKNFKGITFFPIDEKYKVEATFTPMLNGEVIPFPTSANKVKRYKQYGTLKFKIDDQDLILTAYTPEPPLSDAPDYVFIPFRDATSGKTSYGAGRYMELEKADIVQGKVTLDFNTAYNPYCAYSQMYNCPIPPDNNTLPIPVEAGVSYEQSGH